MTSEQIDNMRKAMGTLPSKEVQKTYAYENALSVSHTKLIDYPKNPFKNIVNMATSTWGSGKTGETEGSCDKWSKLTPQNRYLVVLSALTGNTLPVPLESINFVFEHNGIPRHTFDQFARARVGVGISSIGCRDNSKLDAPFVLYPSLYDELMKHPKLRRSFEEWCVKTKDLYEDILNTNSGSWQTARAVLPMSYNHSWTTTINYLALKGQSSRRLMACEEAPIVMIFWKMRQEIEEKVSPLLANYLRPACDGAKKCIYHGGAEGMTKYFSSLFAGCGRWPEEHNYSEFNISCSNYEELSQFVKIVKRDGWVNYGENDYDNLHYMDKKLFEED